MVYGGGNYNNTTNAGVFYSNGNNNSRTNTNTNIGFRAALPRSKGKMIDRSRASIQQTVRRCGLSQEAKDPSPALKSEKVKQRRQTGGRRPKVSQVRSIKP